MSNLGKPPMTAAEKDALRPRIIELRQVGMSWSAIGDIMGMARDTVHSIADPAHKKNRIYERSSRRKHDSTIGKNIVMRPPSGDIEARLAEIPPDTRSPAARLMGDPIFERSALGQRMRRA